MHTPQNSASPVANVAAQPQSPPPIPKKRSVSILTVSLVLTCLCLAAIVGIRSLEGQGPTIEKARAALERTVGEQSEGNIRVTSFTKDDGQKAEVGGIQTYAMAFHAIVSCKVAGIWMSKDSIDPNQLTFKFSKGPQGSGAVVGLNNMVGGGKQVREDQMFIIDGVMHGEKSENGWNFSLREGRIRELGK